VERVTLILIDLTDLRWCAWGHSEADWHAGVMAQRALELLFDSSTRLALHSFVLTTARRCRHVCVRVPVPCHCSDVLVVDVMERPLDWLDVQLLLLGARITDTLLTVGVDVVNVVDLVEVATRHWERGHITHALY